MDNVRRNTGDYPVSQFQCEDRMEKLETRTRLLEMWRAKQMGIVSTIGFAILILEGVNVFLHLFKSLH